MAETANDTCDLVFVTETWRDDIEEIITSEHGDILYLYGGLASQGVGVVGRLSGAVPHKRGRANYRWRF